MSACTLFFLLLGMAFVPFGLVVGLVAMLARLGKNPFEHGGESDGREGGEDQTA